MALELAEIGVVTGLGLAIIGFGAWLARAIAQSAIDRDLERAKAELTAAHSLDLEKFRYELRTAAKEKEIVQADLVGRRATVIADLYAKTSDYLEAAKSFTATVEAGGEPSKDEKVLVLDQAMKDSWVFFRRHRIFLPESLCELIETMYRDVLHAAHDYDFWRYPARSSGKAALKEIEAWEKAEQVVREQVPEILRKIESEFRTLLGVHRAATDAT